MSAIDSTIQYMDDIAKNLVEKLHQIKSLDEETE